MLIKGIACKIFIIFVIFTTIGFGAVIPPNIKAYPKLTGDEVLPIMPIIPYFGGSRSPGDSIGMTAYDCQANGSSGQRLFVDDLNQAHIDWMKMVSATSNRRIVWQFRYADGTYYGECDVSPMTAGYTQLDVTQDVNPDSQRSVIAYPYNPPGSGLYSWIDIYPFGDPRPFPYENCLWPYIAVTANNNIVIMTCDWYADMSYVGVTTDFGVTWTLITDIDSALALSHFVRASKTSGRVVIAWTQSIAVEYSGYLISQMANDVYYILSTDNGMTWGAPVNVTHYLPPGQMANGDTCPWAFCDVNAVFDNNDNLHLAYATNMGYMDNDTLYFNDRSKIFHWDEISNTITTVNTPSWYYNEPNGWWLEDPASGDVSGAWKLPSDDPQLVVGTGNELFCVWTGNDDYTDISAAGFLNGELFGSISTNNGASWTRYRNLTNTRTPGAGAGACEDEDYMTANPIVVNDSIYITYVEDKDAGAYPQMEGVMTQNPVRCWVFWAGVIRAGPGVEERGSGISKKQKLIMTPNPAKARAVVNYVLSKCSRVQLKLYGADGRMVKTIEEGFREAGSYSVFLTARDLASGAYFVEFVAENDRTTGALVIVR